MGKLSLQTYYDKLDELAEQRRYDTLIEWAQHLVRVYPKCILGYRYLAQAAIETGQREEAIDLLRRVLSADPEDHIAYAGLAMLYGEEHLYDEATWHIVRAFELRPENRVIREQVRTLYEAADGRRPGRLKFNRAALGHVYLRNGDYDLAADEFAAVLDEDSSRVDLRVARAEALWRAGKRRQAVEEAEQVLEELPNALKPRLILGQFYAEEGSTDRAAEHLERAQQLDPSNAVAVALFGADSVLQQRALTLSTPEAIPEEPALTDEEEAWLGIDDAFIDFDEETAPAAIQWRDALRDATDEALARRPAQPKEEWRASLRRETEQALAAIVSPVSGAVWVSHLRDATDAALTIVSDTATAWRNDLRQVTDEMLAQRQAEAPAIPGAGRAPAVPGDTWRADLRNATEAALVDLEGAVTEEPAIASPAVEEGVPPEAPAAPIAADAAPTEPPQWAKALREATEEALASEPVPAEEPPALEAAEPVLEPEEPVDEAAAEPAREEPIDELARAIELASAGDEDGALRHFEAIYEAGEGRDEELAEALADWIAGGTTGPLPHQLLGDVYRRMGRLQDAVAQYRETLRKT